jgi:Neprosin
VTSLREMGSGRFADAGPGYAAYVRNPKYYDGLWFGEVPIDDRSTVMRPYEPLCYSRSALENGGFYFGGPGGNAPECTWPSP